MAMKSVIKLRRTSARDALKENCGEELLFPSVGGASPLAGRAVSTCVWRGAFHCLWQGPRTGCGKDDGRSAFSPQQQKESLIVG